MASTAQEALIAELLGDVGKLHDQIKALPDALKASVAPTIGALALASREAKATIDQYADAQKTAFQHFTAQEKAALRAEASETLASLARELEASAQRHREAAREESRQLWSWIGVALAVSLTAGTLGFYGAHLLHDKERDEQAAFGRAVIKVWGDLDAKAKARIQAARR